RALPFAVYERVPAAGCHPPCDPPARVLASFPSLSLSPKKKSGASPLWCNTPSWNNHGNRAFGQWQAWRAARLRPVPRLGPRPPSTAGHLVTHAKLAASFGSPAPLYAAVWG